MFRFCLTRQINEVEILKSVFCGEGELCVWNDQQYAKLQQDAGRRGGPAEEETPQVALQLNLPLDPPYPQDSLAFNITMPAFYPSSDGIELKMKVPRKILSQEQEGELNDAATKFVESKVGQEIVLDLVQFVKEWIYDNVPPVVEPEIPVSAPIQIEKSQSLHASLLGSSPAISQSPGGSSKGLTKPTPPEPKEKEFRRILIWFSTIAPDRAKTVAEWAKQLGLTGISRLGSPALLLVEGQKADVDEYVSSLRSFRWKKMEIVWEDKSICSNINDCRRFTTFQECMVTLPDLQPIFKNAGLEEMYKEGLKIRG